jgi:transposase
MIKREYSQEFKLSVIREYLSSPHGIRIVSRSFGLPSKNYITRWIQELSDAGLVTEDELIAAGKKSSAGRTSKKHPYQVHTPSPKERMLEEENLRLRAENDFLKKLQEIEGRDAKVKLPIKPFSN